MLRFTRMAGVCIVSAALACRGTDTISGVPDPVGVSPPTTMLTAADCTAEECSMTPSIDPENQTVTVWWQGATMKGLATMRFFGNYGRVTISISAGGYSSEGRYENYSGVLPQVQYYEASTQKLTDASCGQTAEGRGTFRAEVRLITSGTMLRSTDATEYSQPAPQPSCKTSPESTNSGGGGTGDTTVETIHYDCFYLDFFENDVWVGRLILGCIFS